jgi:hypothetical protein
MACPTNSQLSTHDRLSGTHKVDSFFAEATSGDYDHLLQTTMAWVDWT